MAQQTPATPTVVASTCRHRLTGGDPPADSATILAATITHCASCNPYIATICHHPVPGTTSRIDRPSAHAICLACTDFINTSKKLLIARSKREAFNNKPTVPRRSPDYRVWRSEWKGLTNAYDLARMEFANAAAYHYDHDDPEFPTVNKRGTALLHATKSNLVDLTPQKHGSSDTPKRVAFDETQECPTRENGRFNSLYNRHNAVYVPGKYASPTGSSFWNTSNPMMDGGEGCKDFPASVRDTLRGCDVLGSTGGRISGDGASGNHDLAGTLNDSATSATGDDDDDDDEGDLDEPLSEVEEAVVDVMADIISNILSIDEMDGAKNHDETNDNHGESMQERQGALLLDLFDPDEIPDSDSEDPDYQKSKALVKAFKRTEYSDEEPTLAEEAQEKEHAWTIGDSYTPDEATLKGFKRSCSRFEEARMDVGPIQTRDETFAIKIVTLEDAMPPPYTSTGPYKNTGFTMPVSQR